ncbi:MAG: DUF4142 domain-containing protein [Magnetospirillum sp.]|nr:DUF4142 domain-containing protein [Magnetospirillum sp.]
MMRHLAAFALVLLSLPAWAQQARTEEKGLPADPRGAQSGRLDTRERQALAALARNAATAQQLGFLASQRAGQGRLGELGQSMAATNAHIGQGLTQLAGPENLPLRERIDQNQIQRLRDMAGADRHNFNRELIGWINRTYPSTIRNMEMLGHDDRRYAALAEATLPQLRLQLSAAQELAQTTMEGEAQQSQQPGRPR